MAIPLSPYEVSEIHDNHDFILSVDVPPPSITKWDPVTQAQDSTSYLTLSLMKEHAPEKSNHLPSFADCLRALNNSTSTIDEIVHDSSVVLKHDDERQVVMLTEDDRDEEDDEDSMQVEGLYSTCNKRTRRHEPPLFFGSPRKKKKRTRLVTYSSKSNLKREKQEFQEALKRSRVEQ